MSINSEELLKRIEKDRYLIPCKCKVCNKTFKDVVLGTQHVYDDHPKRDVKNVIDNLTWNLDDDLKKWKVLQVLKVKRDKIINKLSDERAIDAATIPDLVEIQRKNADISGIMQPLLSDLEKTEKPAKKEEATEEEPEEDIEEDLDERDFESSEDAEEDEEDTEEDTMDSDEEPEELEDEKPRAGQSVKKRNLCELLEREIEKYLNAIKRLSMSTEVEKSLSSRKRSQATLDKYEDQLDYFLGVARAVKILKDSAPDLEIII